MNIGFIGLGVMGSRMVQKLLEAGYSVTVFNRTPAKAESLVEYGAIRVDSIATLAREVDVICTCLSMPSDSLEVYLGPDGIIQNAKLGAICLDFATVGVDTSRTIATQAKQRGISYLDSPVSGGPEGVENGALTIMVGGERASFERISPILQVLGNTIEHLGTHGSGSIAKLINQYLVAVHSIAASEAMVAGVAHGLNSEQLYNILKVSYGESRILRRHMEQNVLDRQFEPGGALKYVYKDISLANPLLEEAGMSEFSGKLAQSLFSRAMQQGLSEQDMSSIIQPFEKECDVTVKRNPN